MDKRNLTFKDCLSTIEYLKNTYNHFNVLVFENTETIIIENNLERWSICKSNQNFKLYHTNERSVFKGKFNSYHLQFQKTFSKKSLIEIFKYIEKHGNKKIYKKSKIDRLFEQIS